MKTARMELTFRTAGGTRVFTVGVDLAGLDRPDALVAQLALVVGSRVRVITGGSLEHTRGPVEVSNAG